MYFYVTDAIFKTCSFNDEGDFCGFELIGENKTKWIQNKGRTSSAFTGPAENYEYGRSSHISMDQQIRGSGILVAH